MKNYPAKPDQNFFEQVYEVVRLVPTGRVTSYGAIARSIGSPGASRMVGWAMNNAHRHPEVVPAHRVVNRIGMLTGQHHFETPGKMQELLEAEGIRVKNNKIEDFKSIFWDPYTELI